MPVQSRNCPHKCGQKMDVSCKSNGDPQSVQLSCPGCGRQVFVKRWGVLSITKPAGGVHDGRPS